MKWVLLFAGLVILIAGVAAARWMMGRTRKKDLSEWPPEIAARVEAARAARAEVNRKSPELFERLRRCFFQHDPMGIGFETNTDEYDPEVGTILPRLPQCKSEVDVLEVVHQEFVQWFDADTAGPKSEYQSVSTEVWKIWREGSRPSAENPTD